MRQIPALALSVALTLAGALAYAEDAAEAGAARSTFDAEICKVDGLTAAQCDCAFKFLAGKLSESDLKLAMLLTASSSDDAEVSKKADQALDKSSASDKRRDALSSETSALVIEAEDACGK